MHLQVFNIYIIFLFAAQVGIKVNQHSDVMVLLDSKIAWLMYLFTLIIIILFF